MTTQTPTLTAWLLEQIEADAAAAEALLAEVDGLSSEPRVPWRAERSRLYMTQGISLGVKPELATHIARHNPAHVLAVCAAHKAIVELHESWPVLVESEPTFETDASGDINSHVYRMSKQIAWTTEQEYRRRFGAEPPTAPTLRALAAAYADRPGYDAGAWGL